MTTLNSEKKLVTLVSRRAADRLRAFHRDVQQAFGRRVTDIVLFGSRARGEAARGSDYDVAVFIADLDDRRAVDHALSDLAYRHLISGFHISPVSVPANFLEQPAPGTLASFIKRDGVPIS